MRGCEDPDIASFLRATLADAGDLPVGRRLRFRIRLFVQPFSVFPKCKSGLYPVPSRPTQGRLAIVTNAGRDAVDAGSASDEGADPADGEVVWS
jgi:hypothetical protein